MTVETAIVSANCRKNWPMMPVRKAHGMNTADKGNDFSRMRTFYEWGVATGIECFDPALLRILKRITAPGNAKGHHVRFRDPQRGPFSSDELLLIRRAIVENKGTDQDRAGQQ